MKMIEKKDKRVQLLMPTSLHDAIKAAAEQRGTSVNDLINSVMQVYLFGAAYKVVHVVAHMAPEQLKEIEDAVVKRVQEELEED